jgi:hypothetical protein
MNPVHSRYDPFDEGWAYRRVYTYARQNKTENLDISVMSGIFLAFRLSPSAYDISTVIVLPI